MLQQDKRIKCIVLALVLVAFSEVAIAQRSTPYQKFQHMWNAWDRRLKTIEGISLNDAFPKTRDLGARKLSVTVSTLDRREIPSQYQPLLWGVADLWQRSNGSWPVEIIFIDDRGRRLCDYNSISKRARCRRGVLQGTR